MKLMLLTALVLVSPGGVASPAALGAELKIGVVDVQKAMEATDHWQKGVAELKKHRAERQAALEAKQSELKKRKEKLEAQSAIRDPAKLAPEEEALVQAAQELQVEYVKSQQELTDREKKLTNQMLSRVEVIVRDIAVKGEYVFVFETGPENAPNVLYAKKSTDLTSKVIASYKGQFKDHPLEL